MHIRIVSPIFRRHYSLREDIRKFREPDKPKKHMLAACQPYFKRVYSEPSESCKGSYKKQDPELGPLEKIILEELLDDIKKSDYTLLIQYNYTKFQTDRVYRNTLTKLGGKFHRLNNNIYREAFGTLKQNDILPLLVTRNALLTGEITTLIPCIKAMKKMPQYLLIAGLIDMHLYRHGQLQSIAMTGSLDDSRANLLSTLYTPALDLSYYLQTHGESDDKKEDRQDEGDN